MTTEGINRNTSDPADHQLIGCLTVTLSEALVDIPLDPQLFGTHARGYGIALADQCLALIIHHPDPEQRPTPDEWQYQIYPACKVDGSKGMEVQTGQEELFGTDRAGDVVLYLRRLMWVPGHA